MHLRSVLEVLRKETLYANLKKCTFCSDKVIFLGFVVSSEGLEVDSEKIKAIQEWPRPTSISQVRSFHGLASFYRCFVPNFSTLAAPLTSTIEKNLTFHWGEEQENSFNIIKDCPTKAPLLALLDFSKTFEIECDASDLYATDDDFGEIFVSCENVAVDKFYRCDDSDLRANRFEEWEDDTAMPQVTPSSNKEPLELPQGPITRSRAKHFKQVVSALVDKV
ncbi:uncharacterized mitochondrial protein AtMg00860-like [Gossypium raimondii]|uniref:uncharacterized mitochondrial protein AtMg00860-like n=1 Tax=Gossypium raimondii TaxID=29730 RepID=UPI00227C0F72|nr:uncharacterized mitochondrial protein AtMg00860-like [Gossypium raimondii]